MKAEIDIIELCELITYNQLFRSVMIPSSIGRAINASSDKHYREMAEGGCLMNMINPFYIEGDTNDFYCILWYPMKAWIDECKRRKEVNTIYDAGMTRVKRAGVNSSKLQELNQALLLAVTSQDHIKTAEIIKQIEELNK